ncbi:MAG TPA: hypothetical protein VFH73_18775 [Polyangia bacterium]|jgi:hypothetical protein|nr:hypothetical protein [Polyangia bacterium]
MHVFGAAPGPVIALALVGLSVGLPIFLWLLRRMFRGLSDGMQVPLHGSIYFIITLFCFAMIGVGLTGVGLVLALRDYRAVGPKTFLAQIRCAESSPARVTMDYIPIGADGSRGSENVFQLDGRSCSVLGEMVRFRPFLTHVGLGTFARLISAAGQGENTPAGQRQPLDRAPSAIPDWLRLERDAKHPLGLLLDDARTSGVTQQPEGRGAFVNVYVTPAGYQLGPGAS